MAELLSADEIRRLPSGSREQAISRLEQQRTRAEQLREDAINRRDFKDRDRFNEIATQSDVAINKLRSGSGSITSEENVNFIAKSRFPDKRLTDLEAKYGYGEGQRRAEAGVRQREQIQREVKESGFSGSSQEYVTQKRAREQAVLRERGVSQRRRFVASGQSVQATPQQVASARRESLALREASATVNGRSVGVVRNTAFFTLPQSSPSTAVLSNSPTPSRARRGNYPFSSVTELGVSNVAGASPERYVFFPTQEGVSNIVPSGRSNSVVRGSFLEGERFLTSVTGFVKKGASDIVQGAKSARITKSERLGINLITTDPRYDTKEAKTLLVGGALAPLAPLAVTGTTGTIIGGLGAGVGALGVGYFGARTADKLIRGERFEAGRSLTNLALSATAFARLPKTSPLGVRTTGIPKGKSDVRIITRAQGTGGTSSPVRPLTTSRFSFVEDVTGFQRFIYGRTANVVITQSDTAGFTRSASVGSRRFVFTQPNEGKAQLQVFRNNRLIRTSPRQRIDLSDSFSISVNPLSQNSVSRAEQLTDFSVSQTIRSSSSGSLAGSRGRLEARGGFRRDFFGQSISVSEPSQAVSGGSVLEARYPRGISVLGGFSGDSSRFSTPLRVGSASSVTSQRGVVTSNVLESGRFLDENTRLLSINRLAGVRGGVSSGFKEDSVFTGKIFFRQQPLYNDARSAFRVALSSRKGSQRGVFNFQEEINKPVVVSPLKPSFIAERISFPLVASRSSRLRLFGLGSRRLATGVSSTNLLRQNITPRTNFSSRTNIIPRSIIDVLPKETTIPRYKTTQRTSFVPPISPPRPSRPSVPRLGLPLTPLVPVPLFGTLPSPSLPSKKSVSSSRITNNYSYTPSLRAISLNITTTKKPSKNALFSGFEGVRPIITR